MQEGMKMIPAEAMMDLRITAAAARVNAGYSQDEAAKMLGISKGTLVNYEKGRTVPSWEMVHRMGSVYKFPAENIIFGKKYA